MSDEAWARVRDHTRGMVAERAQALSWRGRLAVPNVVIWLQSELARTEDGRALLPEIVQEALVEYLTAALHSDLPVTQSRAASAILDRLAVRLALRELGGACETSNPEESTLTPCPPRARPSVSPSHSPVSEGRGEAGSASSPQRPTPSTLNTQHSTLNTQHSTLNTQRSTLNTQRSTLNTQHSTLSHTPLGQPFVAGHPDLHVSFSHDGDAHLCFLARSSGLKGVGIDVVHLPRLRSRSDEYLRRFAGHFMSDEEYRAFSRDSAHETGDALMVRAAAHFSLMEAASKALGTGLKIGAGMGKPESLQKQSLGALRLEPEIEMLVGPEARERCALLMADRLEGHWAADAEYGVSVVLLWSKGT